MSKDISFEGLANILDKSGKVRVEFESDCIPHSVPEQKLIVLPIEIKNVGVNKRIELLGYLMHEVGHLLKSHSCFFAGDSGIDYYIKLLEDIRIQPTIESLMPSASQISDYINELISAKKRAMGDKLYSAQVFLDHVNMIYSGGERFCYNEEVTKKIKSMDGEIRPIVEKFKTAANEIERILEEYGPDKIGSALSVIVPHRQAIYESATALKKLLGDHIDPDSNRKFREDKDKLKAAISQSKSQEITQQMEIDTKHNERLQDIRHQKKESMERAKKITNDKKQAKVEGDKTKHKDLCRAVREEKELREKLCDDIDVEMDDYDDQATQAHVDYEKSKRDTKKAENELSRHAISTCAGINNIDAEFIGREIEKLKQSTSASMNRLFRKFYDKIEHSLQGDINGKYLTEYWDAEKLLRKRIHIADVEASVVFLLDNSPSMGKRSSPTSKLCLCWNSFESIVKAMHRASGNSKMKVQYATTWFNSSWSRIKTFKEKHSQAKMDKMQQEFMSRQGGGTDILRSLEDAWNQIKKREGKKLIFVLTDGATSDEHNKHLYSWWRKLSRSDVKILSIGIGMRQGRDFLGNKCEKTTTDIGGLEACLSEQIKRALTR